MKSVKKSKADSIKKKLQDIYAWNGSAPGQIFDTKTYAGCVRFIVFSILVIYVGGHIDAILDWINLQFGETTTVSPGKEAWHRVVAQTIGTIGITASAINIYNIYIERNKKNTLLLPPLEADDGGRTTHTPPTQNSTTEHPHAEPNTTSQTKRDD